MLYDGISQPSVNKRWTGLNAPFGARCFMTKQAIADVYEDACLNAPFGARCFMTRQDDVIGNLLECLNAPFGARCFMTVRRVIP